jgi:hypothetical protein
VTIIIGHDLEADGSTTTLNRGLSSGPADLLSGNARNMRSQSLIRYWTD